MYCPYILEFNAELEVCDWPFNAKCSADKNKVTTAAQVVTFAPIDLQTEFFPDEPTIGGKKREKNLSF